MSFAIGGKLDVQPALDLLLGLSAGVQRSVVRPALMSASVPMLAAVKARLPGSGGYRGHFGVETGLMKRSLGKIGRTYPEKNLVVVVIGPRAGMGETVTLDPNNIYRQVGGRRAGKGAQGVFGKTKKIHEPRADQLSRYEDPANIAHFVEGGHKNKSNRRAYPFIRPAFEDTKGVSAAIFTERVRQLLEALVSKLPRVR